MNFEKKDKVLVVAAHPDDDVLGCGGTIAFLRKKGINVRVLFLAEGITARYLKKDFETNEVKKEIEYRNQCALNALKILGVKKDEIFFNNYQCLNLDQISFLNITKTIENHVYDFMPTNIFTHAKYDVNNDHTIVNKSTLAATRPFD